MRRRATVLTPYPLFSSSRVPSNESGTMEIRGSPDASLSLSLSFSGSPSSPFPAFPSRPVAGWLSSMFVKCAEAAGGV